MNRRSWFTLVFSLFCVLPTSTMADDLDKTQRAMQLIESYVESICGFRGSDTTITAEANGNAQVSELVKKLADLHVGAAAQYTNESYQGPLRHSITHKSDAQLHACT